MLTVRAGIGPIRPPYVVSVRYDLRSKADTFRNRMPHLAAIDADILIEHSRNLGIDALASTEGKQVQISSQSLCTWDGQPIPLESLRAPGEVQVRLRGPAEVGQDQLVFLRIVAIRSVKDDADKDWQPIGDPVVLRLCPYAEGFPNNVTSSAAISCPLPVVNPNGGLSVQRSAKPEAEETSSLSADQRPEMCGLRMHQLTQFAACNSKDLKRYCNGHRTYKETSSARSKIMYHVCCSSPCPYKDAHEDVPHMEQSLVPRGVDVQPLVSNMHVVVERKIKPDTKGTKRSWALLMNHARPLRAGVFVSHSWQEDFDGFVETLSVALPQDEVVWISGFSVYQHRVFETSDTLQTCLRRALQNSKQFLMVLGAEVTAPSRLWCLYEASQAREWGIPANIWLHKKVDILEVERKLENLDVSVAETTQKRDEAHILEAVNANTAAEQLTATLRRYMCDRLKIYIESYHEAVSRFEDRPTAETDELWNLISERLRNLQRERAVYDSHGFATIQLHKTLEQLQGLQKKFNTKSEAVNDVKKRLVIAEQEHWQERRQNEHYLENIVQLEACCEDDAQVHATELFRVSSSLQQEEQRAAGLEQSNFSLSGSLHKFESKEPVNQAAMIAHVVKAEVRAAAAEAVTAVLDRAYHESHSQEVHICGRLAQWEDEACEARTLASSLETAEGELGASCSYLASAEESARASAKHLTALLRSHEEHGQKAESELQYLRKRSSQLEAEVRTATKAEVELEHRTCRSEEQAQQAKACASHHEARHLTLAQELESSRSRGWLPKLRTRHPRRVAQ